MRVPAAFYMMLGAALTIGATSPGSASAQVPTVESQPRVAVPARGAVAAPRDQAAPAAAPAAQPAPAPEPVTQVTGAPAGVTQLPAAGGATSSSSQAATARGYVAGNFALTLDGVQAGFIKSVEGGTPTSEVVVEGTGSSQVAKKHLGALKYEDIAVSTTLDSKPLMDWIVATWKAGYQRKSGSVLEADYNLTVRREREFFNALLTEATFPTLDGASKDAASITVKIAPEYTRLKAGSGATISGAIGSKLQMKWLPSNFRFEMTGLDGSRVNRIESFTVSQKAATDDVGAARDYQKEPGKLEFPNLKITLSESSAQTWSDWFEDFVVKGNNGEDKERDGAIVYLDGSLKSELGRINLYNCGIFRLASKKAEAGADQIQRMVAELYCERMEFVAKN